MAERLKVYYRLTDGRKVQLFYKSEIEVDPNNWNRKKSSIQSKGHCIDGQIYGTPYDLTIKERNYLYKFDLSAHPELAEQLDKQY